MGYKRLMADHPHLTLVDPNALSEHDQEFLPLPYYGWDERPPTVPLDSDEIATALHLAHGDDDQAARLLKVPVVRLQRLVKQSPRLQRIRSESLDVALARAAHIPIQTLFDPEADARRLEWASTKVLQSRLAIGHPLSPAPAQPSAQQSLSINQQNRSITFRWRTDADDARPDGDDVA